jgi:hypothetical protein
MFGDVGKEPKLIKRGGTVYLATEEGAAPLRDLTFDDVSPLILNVGPLGPTGEFFGYDRNTYLMYFLTNGAYASRALNIVRTGEIPIYRLTRAMTASKGTLDMFWANPDTKGMTKLLAAAMQYVRADDKIIITHMSVLPKWRRNRINSLMVDTIAAKYPGRPIVFDAPTDLGKKFMSSRGLGGASQPFAVRLAPTGQFVFVPRSHRRLLGDPGSRRSRLVSAHETILSRTHPLRQQLAQAAQTVYDAWQVDEQGYDWQVGGGGICHLIADAMVDVLARYGVRASGQSCSHMVHVNVIAQFREGIFEVDINPYDYETGSGYSWKKLPDITFDKHFVQVAQLDHDPFNLRLYLEDYEPGDDDEPDDEPDDE